MPAKSSKSRPLIAEIKCCVQGVLSGGTSLVFVRIPSPVGLACNSVADIAAKAAKLLPVCNLTVPHLDYNSLIYTQALKQWNLEFYVGILKLRTSCMQLKQG